jgi:Cobalamin-independent synthase, Catalytic domain
VNCDVLTLEMKDRSMAEIELLGSWKGRTKKKIAIGVVSHRTLNAETPDEVAADIRRALQYIDIHNLLITSDCGFGRQGANRMVAFYKSAAAAQGANIVRREHGLRETYIPCADPRLIQDQVPTEFEESGASAASAKRSSADVGITRVVQFHNLTDQHSKILIERPICGQATERRLPQMNVAVDKAGYGNHAAPINFGHGPTAGSWADCDDFAVVDKDIARFDDSQRGIHRNDRRPLNADPRQHASLLPSRHGSSTTLRLGGVQLRARPLEPQVGRAHENAKSLV